MNELVIEAIRNQDFAEVKRLSYFPGFSVLDKGEDQKRLIHYAVDSGSEEIVDFLLRRGSPLNVADANGTYPLHAACINGDIPIVTRLLRGGAFVNRSHDREGRLPIHIAAENGDLDLIATLLMNGASLFQRTVNEAAQTAVQLAMRERQERVVRYIFALCYFGCFSHPRVNAADAQFSFKEASIQKCCADLFTDSKVLSICTCSRTSDYDIPYTYSNLLKDDNGSLLTQLLENCDIHGRSPLLVAVEYGLVRCVELLLAIGASSIARDHRGRGLFHFAALCSPTSEGLMEMLELLTTNWSEDKTQAQDQNTDVFSLLNSADCHFEIVETNESQVEGQAQPIPSSSGSEETDGEQSESLSDGEQSTRSESVTYTYTYTISVTSNENNESPHPVSIAIDRSLLNAVDNDGLSPVHYAVLNRNHTVLRTILRNGASIDNTPAVNEDDTHAVQPRKPVSSALHVAVALPDLESVRIVLEFGADPNQEDSNGGTAMHRLFSTNSPSRRDILMALLEHGAILNVEDKLGFTPFSRFILSCVVQRRVEMDILQTLVSAGAILEPQRSERLSENVRHNSALLWLCTIDASDAIQLLVDADWNLQKEDWLSVVYDEELRSVLTAKRDSVNRLTNQCRTQIRKWLLRCTGNREIVSRIMQLGLPEALKHYLLFK